MDNNKLNRILSIIALVFVGIFSVALILFFIDPYMLGGVIAFICLVSGFVGLTLFVILKLLMRQPTNGLAGYVDTHDDDDVNEDEEGEEAESSDGAADNHLSESEDVAEDAVENEVAGESTDSQKAE